MFYDYGNSFLQKQNSVMFGNEMLMIAVKILTTQFKK